MSEPYLGYLVVNENGVTLGRHKTLETAVLAVEAMRRPEAFHVEGITPTGPNRTVYKVAAK